MRKSHGQYESKTLNKEETLLSPVGEAAQYGIYQIDKDLGEKERQNLQERDKTSLFEIEMYGERRYFRNESGLSADDLCKAYAECEKPFVEMGRYGKEIGEVESAEIEQSDKFGFSVKFDADENQISIFDGNRTTYRCLSEAVESILAADNQVKTVSEKSSIKNRLSEKKSIVSGRNQDKNVVKDTKNQEI